MITYIFPYYAHNTNTTFMNVVLCLLSFMLMPELRSIRRNAILGIRPIASGNEKHYETGGNIMKNSKKLISVSLIVLMLGLVAGCGNRNANNTDNNGAGTENNTGNDTTGTTGTGNTGTNNGTNTRRSSDLQILPPGLIQQAQTTTLPVPVLLLTEMLPEHQV